MRGLAGIILLFLTACAPAGQTEDARTHIVVQRFFGACEADYGTVTDPEKAQGECGIMTALINRFEAENPDIEVTENIVFWPGYDQLTAGLAANDAPDLVAMHGSVLSDYQSRGLLLPLGDGLARHGIDAGQFTDAARNSVSINGAIWALSIDSWSSLWHVNMTLFEQAGLVRNGRPIMPRSPEDLIAHARQFKQRTGKPYFVQATANEYASFTRNFYTFVMQQNAPLFRDARHANFQTDEARRVLMLFKAIHDEKLTTMDQDYSAAVSGFMNGDGGVFLVGTWMVQSFAAEARKKGRPLFGGYQVHPYPQLFARNVSFSDSHTWAMPKNARRTAGQTAAAFRFLAFFAAHNKDWAATGHMPAMQSVIDSAEWQQMPHRAALAGLPNASASLPKDVRRQFPIETIVGQEAAAAISGAKSIDQALADMQRRVDDILNNI